MFYFETVLRIEKGVQNKKGVFLRPAKKQMRIFPYLFTPILDE
jgi:hypothetical protein